MRCPDSTLRTYALPHTWHLRGRRRIPSRCKPEPLMQARGVKLHRDGMGAVDVERKRKLATAFLAQTTKNSVFATLHGARRQPYITCVCSLRKRPPTEVSTFKAPSPFVCICRLAFAACGSDPQQRFPLLKPLPPFVCICGLAFAACGAPPQEVGVGLHHRPGDSHRRMQSAIRKAGCSEITPCRLRITPYGSGPQGGSG